MRNQPKWFTSVLEVGELPKPDDRDDSLLRMGGGDLFVVSVDTREGTWIGLRGTIPGCHSYTGQVHVALSRPISPACIVFIKQLISARACRDNSLPAAWRTAASINDLPLAPWQTPIQSWFIAGPALNLLWINVCCLQNEELASRCCCRHRTSPYIMSFTIASLL